MALFGTRKGSYIYNSYGFFTNSGYGTNYVSYFRSGQETREPFTLELNIKYKIECYQLICKLYKNNFLVKNITASNAINDSGVNRMYIFDLNKASNDADYNDNSTHVGRLYYFKIYESDNLIRNFIPCISPTGEVGLYDTVGNQFYKSPNGTKFVAGPLANGENLLNDNTRWAKIFYHNNHAGTVLFKSLEECKFSNTTDKFSLFDVMNANWQMNGKYEFLLKYESQPGKYNRWQQTKRPQDEYMNNTRPVTGYNAIHIDWTDSFWGGLERQNSDVNSISSCWINGSVGHGNWFYAIGSSASFNGGIPSNASAETKGTTLYIRIK